MRHMQNTWCRETARRETHIALNAAMESWDDQDQLNRAHQDAMRNGIPNGTPDGDFQNFLAEDQASIMVRAT